MLGTKLRKVPADLVSATSINDFLHIFLYHIHAQTRKALILKPLSCIKECVQHHRDTLPRGQTSKTAFLALLVEDNQQEITISSLS